MSESPIVQALRDSAPYVHDHHGRTFVVAFGGEAADRADFDRLIFDIALLRSLGVQVVLVHGARPQVERALSARGLESRYVDDLRVTDADALACAKAAIGALRMDIEARLSTGLASSPMGGARLKVATGNWITAQPVGVRQGVDLQHTGRVRKVDAPAIRANLEAGRICLLSPIGYSTTGEIFDLRAEEVATQVAAALSADKLLFLVPGEPREWGLAKSAGDVGQMRVSDAVTLLESDGEAWSADDRRCLQSVAAAGRGGVRRIHVLSMESDGGLLRELYTRDGTGLLFHADDAYESIRAATIEDIGGILALIQPLEDSGALVPRSREQLELDIVNFFVMVRDGLVIACAALFPHRDAQAAELACIAVHPDYQGNGCAATLLKRLQRKARDEGLKRLFSLTTQAPHWFIERGFRKGAPVDLPAQRQALYNDQRNALVLVQDL